MNEILSFNTPSAFRIWLKQNHLSSDGIWLRISKKGAEAQSITYAEALDEALCFGWIDGQKKPFDKFSWLQRFTPRRAKSNWSRVNTQHVERLIAEGKMDAAGHAAIESAKADGRWAAAYDSFSNATFPDDFLVELQKNERAEAFFRTLSKANLYAISYRLQTAKKPETRQKRMEMILGMLDRGEAFH